MPDTWHINSSMKPWALSQVVSPWNAFQAPRTENSYLFFTLDPD